MARQTTSVKMEGLSDLLKALKALPPELASKNGGVIRSAVAAGARFVRDEVARVAPVSEGLPTSGRLKRNVFVYRSRNPKRYGMNEEYLLAVRKGPRGKRGASRTRQLAKRGLTRAQDPRDAYYARFLELGTKHIRARSFIGLTFEAKKRQALDLIISRARRGVLSAVKKHARLTGGR